MCAFHPEISSLFSKSFPFLFLFFVLSILWYFPFHVVSLSLLFVTGVSLMEMKICNAIATKMVVCALLPWLVHPSYLTGESLQLASKILVRGNENSTWPSYTSRLYGNKLFNHLRNTDSLVGSAADMSKLAESWQSNPINALQWLRRLTEVPDGINEQLQLFVSALFIHNFEQNEIQQESFKLLLKLVEINKEFTATAITLILYKLAEEKDPVAQLELLRGLTKMAMQKVSTISTSTKSYVTKLKTQLIGMLLVSRSELVEENAVEMFHHCVVYLFSCLLM